MKITRNDAEYVSKLYIKFCLKRLKNEYFSGVGFLYLVHTRPTNALVPESFRHCIVVERVQARSNDSGHTPVIYLF